MLSKKKSGLGAPLGLSAYRWRRSHYSSPQVFRAAGHMYEYLRWTPTRGASTCTQYSRRTDSCCVFHCPSRTDQLYVPLCTACPAKTVPEPRRARSRLCTLLLFCRNSQSSTSSKSCPCFPPSPHTLPADPTAWTRVCRRPKVSEAWIPAELFLVSRPLLQVLRTGNLTNHRLRRGMAHSSRFDSGRRRFGTAICVVQAPLLALQ